MAKDDYFVLAYKILSYLYAQLKAGEDVDSAMLAADSPMLRTNEKYWAYILQDLQEQGYIRYVKVSRVASGATVIMDYSQCQITPDGIEYLDENSAMARAKQFLKGAKDMVLFF